jgi:hypothetical protein
LALAHCQFIFTMSNVQEMKKRYLNVRIGVWEHIIVVTTTLLVFHVHQVTFLKYNKEPTTASFNPKKNLGKQFQINVVSII